MSRDTPQAAFEHVQAAMLRGDLFEVFASLDVNDLKRVAANAVVLSLGARIDDADEDVRRICDEHLSTRRSPERAPARHADARQGSHDEPAGHHEARPGRDVEPTRVSCRA